MKVYILRRQQINAIKIGGKAENVCAVKKRCNENLNFCLTNNKTDSADESLYFTQATD